MWATRTGDTLSIAERGFDIRLDALAGWALRVILETTGGPSSADLESALFCAALVEEITGGETIEIPVLWTSVDIDASLLTKANTDSDGVADRLVSTDSYVGEFTKLPTPIDPVVIATFEAGR